MYEEVKDSFFPWSFKGRFNFWLAKYEVRLTHTHKKKTVSD